jgi:hypothetical protein
MTSGRRNGWDPLAAIASVIALVMIVLYVGLIRRQGNQIAVWFLSALAVAAVLSVYGIARCAPRRVVALVVSGVTMTLLGIAGLLSIGLPILVAGVLALLAAGGVASRAPRP